MKTPGIQDVFVHMVSLLYEGPTPEIERNLRRLAQEITRSPEAAGTTFSTRLMNRLSTLPGKRLPESAESLVVVQGLLECVHNGWVSEAGPGMKTGIWDHHKGGVYRVERIATFGDGQPVIEYTSMTTGEDFARYCHEWVNVVNWPDGKYRSRYVYRGPTLKVPPPIFKVAPLEEANSMENPGMWTPMQKRISEALNAQTSNENRAQAVVDALGEQLIRPSEEILPLVLEELQKCEALMASHICGGSLPTRIYHRLLEEKAIRPK